MAASEREAGIREGRGKLGRGGAEGSQVIGIQANGEPVRNDGPDPVAASPLLHRPFEPALDLDGTDGRPEQPRGLALEEPFEKALDGGKGSHVGGGV